MKKSLLLGAGLLALGAFQAQADTAPVSLGDYFITWVSDNGKWAVSDPGYGTVVVFDISDLSDIKKYESFADEVNYEFSYNVGLGNCISNDGVIVGNVDWSCMEGYYKRPDGEWTALKKKEGANGMYIPNAISADGRVICGLIGLSAWGGEEDEIMEIPGIWVLGEDGEYGDPIVLPYPEKDFLGKVPQRVTAHNISADGKVVLGQVVDFTGNFCQPIVFTQAEDGSWNYEVLATDVVNPEGLQLGVLEDGPMEPDPTTYMTEEEQNAYFDAQSAFWNGETEEAPEPKDYMTEEEWAIYEAAMEAYQKAYAEWEVKYNEYWGVIEKIQQNGVFVYNTLSLSPNGQYAVTSLGKMEENGWGFMSVAQCDVCAFNLATEAKAMKTYAVEGASLLAYQATDKMQVIAHFNPSDGSPRKSYVLADMEGEFQPLTDYLTLTNPLIGEWLQKNLNQEYEIYVENPETGYWDSVVNEEVTTGLAVAFDDFHRFILSADELDYDANAYYRCYIIDDQYTNVNQTVAAAKASVKVEKNGVVSVEGDAKALAIYAADGAKVADVTSPQGNVARLNNGLFIVSLTDADGNVNTLKILVK